MAENDSGEKTEEPTAKKLSDARKKGQVFQSRDVVTAVVLFATFTVIRLYIPTIYRDLRDFLRFVLDQFLVEEPLSSKLFFRFMFAAMKDSLPLLLTTMASAILATIAQTRGNISWDLVKPDFSHLSPARGIKRVFSLRNLVEVLKNILKIVILLAFSWLIVKKDIVPLARMMDMNLQVSVQALASMIFDLFVRVMGAFLAIAFVDFLYQRWQYHTDMKMTKQEVKDEYKNTEGNPEIKGRIRRIQRARAQQRMMQAVPQADVVVRNPTHLAIALKYDPDRSNAPVVLAKGKDSLALRIVERAAEYDIPTIENKPLAHALYPACEVGREIPPEFYGAVAEILVYIYRQEGKEEMFR